MNESDKGRGQEYSRVVVGKALKGSDLEDLVRRSSTFEEFRIRLVQRFATKNEDTKKIAAKWKHSIILNRAPDVADANLLLHRLESLSQKQSEVDRKMREANVDLLERLKALDATATDHATLRKNVDEIRFQMREIRKFLERSELVPTTQIADGLK